MNSIDERIAKQCDLIVVHDNMAELSRTDKTAFAILRRNGFGASDSSILLGVNPYEKGVDNLIEQKCLKELTPEEIRVSELPSVRKGSDLEPLILQKFEDWANIGLRKPEPMYKLKDEPQLTVNFDGVAEIQNQFIPVEAKCVSSFAHKYWDLRKSIPNIFGGTKYQVGGKNVKDHIEQVSSFIGIPPYYYTQVQQQLLALKADFGYLVGLFEKDWNIHVYRIYRDDFVIQQLIEASRECWNKVIARRNA